MKGKPEYKTRRFKREINWPLHLRTNCSGEHTLELVVTEVCRNVLVQSFQPGRYKGMKQTLKCKNAKMQTTQYHALSYYVTGASHGK